MNLKKFKWSKMMPEQR